MKYLPLGVGAIVLFLAVTMNLRAHERPPGPPDCLPEEVKQKVIDARDKALADPDHAQLKREAEALVKQDPGPLASPEDHRSYFAKVVAFNDNLVPAIVHEDSSLRPIQDRLMTMNILKLGRNEGEREVAEGGRGQGPGGRVAAAREKALADNPDLKAEIETLMSQRPGPDAPQADRDAYSAKVEAAKRKLHEAMLKEDPTLADGAE